MKLLSCKILFYIFLWQYRDIMPYTKKVLGHRGHALFCFTMSLLSASRLCACLGLFQQICAIVASYQSGLSKVLLCKLDNLAQACRSFVIFMCFWERFSQFHQRGLPVTNLSKCMKNRLTSQHRA